MCVGEPQELGGAPLNECRLRGAQYERRHVTLVARWPADQEGPGEIHYARLQIAKNIDPRITRMAANYGSTAPHALSAAVRRGRARRVFADQEARFILASSMAHVVALAVQHQTRYNISRTCRKL